MTSVAAGGDITTYSYLRDGRLDTVSYPNGTTAEQTYDAAGRIATLWNRQFAATVSRFGYQYDQNGNRTEQTEEHSGASVETTTYSYDAADRLETVVYPEKTVVYSYDAVGNRLTEQATDADSAVVLDRSYTYNPRQQLTGLTDALDPTKSVTYTYDLNGNQTGRQTGAGDTTTFAFDTLDRMIRVEDNSGPVGTYTYDPDGLRIEKLTANGTARYVYDDLAVLTRGDADGVTKYTYGPDRLLSVDDPTEGKAFYLQDALGSVVNLTTPAGGILARYQWDAWGNVRSEVGTEANPFGFTGHEHDEESGLVYAKARMYDPELGRFLSEDAVGGPADSPPSLHAYLYAFQNPTVFTDPDGNVEKIAAARDWLYRGGDASVELAGELKGIFGTSALGRLAEKAGSAALGVAGGASRLLGAGVGAINTTANVAIAGSGAQGELADQAANELVQVEETIEYVVENPGAVGAAIVDATVDTAAGVARGDNQAIASAAATLTEIGVPIPSAVAAGRRLAGGAQAGRATAQASAEAAQEAARAAGQAAETAGRTATLRAATNLGRHVEGPGNPIPAPVRAGRGVDPVYCFVAGTLVATAQGHRPIEEIGEGDFVWSRSEETGELALRPVAQLFVTPDQATVEIEIVSESGHLETIGATLEHPFWVPGEGWVPAGRLEPGDELWTWRDEWLRVRQVRGSPERETVYNLEVAEDHTYFVGEAEAWVHNTCDEISFDSSTGRFRDRATGRLVSFSDAAMRRGGNELPADSRYARIFPREFAEAFVEGSGRIGPPGAHGVFVTAAEDVAGLTTRKALQERLSLFSDRGATVPNTSGNAVVRFTIPNPGKARLRSPVQTRPARGFGFVHGGRTRGGAREFLVNNGTAGELGLEDLEILPLGDK